MSFGSVKCRKSTLVPRLCLGMHCLQGSAFPLHATVFATTQTYILSPRLHLASRPCVSDNAHFSNKLEDSRPKRVDLALYRVGRRSLADSAFPGGAWERGQCHLQNSGSALEMIHPEPQSREATIDYDPQYVLKWRLSRE